MPYLYIEQAAEDDLDAMWASSDQAIRDAAADIEVLLDEICNDDDFLSRMHGSKVRRLSEPSTDTDRIISYWKQGLNILRLKVWSGGALLDYRVIYAYNPSSDSFHILGIGHRSYCYDEHHIFGQRILRLYDSLGLRRF